MIFKKLTYTLLLITKGRANVQSQIVSRLSHGEVMEQILSERTVSLMPDLALTSPYSKVFKVCMERAPQSIDFSTF